MRWLDGITDSTDTNLSAFWEIVKDREVWFAAVHGVTKRHNLAIEKQQQNISGQPSLLSVLLQTRAYTVEGVMVPPTAEHGITNISWNSWNPFPSEQWV